MTTENLPDFVNMTMEEMDEWVASEEAKTPFTTFDLSTDEGRQGLLRKYYMIGDTSLFEAVSHIWASLNEPKAVYGAGIGIAAGTGGKGKRGIVLALHQFLAKALAGIIWIHVALRIQPRAEGPGTAFSTPWPEEGRELPNLLHV